MKPLRVPEPGDEKMEARDSEGCEDSHLFLRQLHGSPIVPRTPNEHCPPVQMLALGPCEARKHFTHIKSSISSLSPISNRKKNAFGLCPQLCHSHMSILVRQNTLGWSPRRGCVEQGSCDTSLSSYLGNLCISL